MKIVIDGCIEALNTRVDNTWVIKFCTQELDGSNVSLLSDLKKGGGYCKVLISNTNITSVEEELVDKTSIPAVKKNKTPSQRLRAVLYRNFEQSGLEIEFEQYYNAELERIIEHYRAKLQ